MTRADFRVVRGECVDAMRALPDASVDAVVTDPPYDLTANKRGGTGSASLNLDSPAGRARIGTGGGFMGKAWDATGIAFDPATWREVLRVLKPGGYLAAFGGTRTYHRMACAIEDAGFEIRDSLHWIYGSGFPKSLDVSKAIDKTRNDDVRPVCRFLRATLDRLGVTPAEVARVFGFHPRMIEHWAARDTDTQPTVPTVEQWERLRSWLGFGHGMDDEVARLNARKGEPGDAWRSAEVLGEHEGTPGGLGGERFTYRDRFVRAPSADAAAWQGWGTALKPAHEPIVLARKPLEGTVARNVLAHGTGALNIDAARVATDDEIATSRPVEHDSPGGWNESGRAPTFTGSPAGRWPPNVILAHGPGCGAECAPGCPVAELDAQSGESTCPETIGRGSTREGAVGFFRDRPVVDVPGFGDSGGASRFFPCFRYVAKPARSERDAGLFDLAPRSGGEATDREDGSAGLRSPRAGAGRNGGARNHHPTVKPIELMEWLCRLVTPRGGTVLDPFLGSGTTGCAAVRLGFRFVGIEREAEYVELAERRIALAANAPRAKPLGALERAPEADPRQIPLFAKEEREPCATT